MRARALAAVLALAACGGGGAKEPEKPKASTVDERRAEKDAKGLVTEIYSSIGHGNTDGLMALLADPLFVFGPRKSDVLATRADALVTLRGILDKLEKDKKPSLKSESLSVVASPGGLSAWAVDTLDVEGEPMAITAVLTNADDIWVVNVAAVAHTPSMRLVRSELKKDAVVPPAMKAPGKVPDAAEGAVDRFKRGLADPGVWADDLGKRGDAIVIGPSAGDVTRGKKDIAKLWKKRAKVNVRHALAGDVSAGTTSDGQIAWVTAPVVRFEDDDDPLPLRLFSIFEKTDGAWTMITLQESLAIDEPGQGASFKKVEPPAVKKEEPPPTPKTDEKPKKKQKKKKSGD